MTHIWIPVEWSICESWLGVCLKSKLRENQQRLISYLRTEFQVYLCNGQPGAICWDRLYDLFSSWVFLPFFNMLILSLPPLALNVKCTFFNSGFCVCRPRQFDTIFAGSWYFSGFFLFSSGWFFGQIESMNVTGVLQEAGDAGLQDLYQITRVSWILY